MNAKTRKISPLCTPENYCTSIALCSAVKQFYKVKDSEEWYKNNRKRIVDNALADIFNVSKFETIHEWHDYYMKKYQNV